MNRKLLALYGLKFNPFLPDVPMEALRASPAMESFCLRVEQGILREGGFALVTGEAGTGKSVVMRLLAERLRRVPDVTVGVLTRPQAHVADFYRELGEVFGVSLRPHNRWAGTKALRQRWEGHMEAAGTRAVLLVDEAQEMRPAVLSELRLLSSVQFDSRQLLSVVLAGDGRLREKFRLEELVPLGSRIRTRLSLEGATPQELLECLKHVLAAAGNPMLMTAELMATICEHALGNYRVLMNTAAELLAVGAQREAPQLDQKLFLEMAGAPRKVAAGTAAGRRG